LVGQLRPPLHDEPARLVEAAGRYVLLVDIHHQLAVQDLRMPDQSPTGTAALERVQFLHSLRKPWTFGFSAEVRA
jgi:hypothetical protein